MKTTLTREQIDRYREDGFLVIEDLLSPHEVEPLRRATDRAVEALGPARVVDNPGLDEPPGVRHTVAKQRLNLWKKDSTVRSALLDPELAKMLCVLLGVDGLRVFHDQTFFKPPWGRPTAYHLDQPNWSFSDQEGIQIWIALEEVNIGNGCLVYLPGTQRVTDRDKTASISGETGALFELYPELAHISPVCVPLPAGGGAIHSGLTVHASCANMTSRWRRALSCQYMPDGSTFNGRRSIMTDEQLQGLELGATLNDERHHPLIHPRSAT